MMRQALVVALAACAVPAAAEPYRALPRYPPQQVRARAATSLGLERALAPSRSTRPVAIAVPAAEVARPAAGSAAAALAPAELKISLGQGSDVSHFVMLVEDASGARIELTLDEGGRLVGVRSAPSRLAGHEGPAHP